MTCVHLRKLYELCQSHDLRLGGADLIHIVCHECGEKEVCPSGLMDELPEEGGEGGNGVKGNEAKGNRQ